MGDRYGEAQTLWGRGRTYAAKEDWATALPDLERAAQLFEEMEARPSLARSLHDRAKVLRGVGRREDAERDERRSTELGRELGLRDSPFA
jgi:tetratricopeptide (TPR) repeat protein